jgi:hypothetical protein
VGNFHRNEQQPAVSRISIPAPDSAPATSKALREAVHRKFGVVLNVFPVAALSPAALDGLLAVSDAVAKTLDVKTRLPASRAVAGRPPFLLIRESGDDL